LGFFVLIVIHDDQAAWRCGSRQPKVWPPASQDTAGLQHSIAGQAAARLESIDH
jgi:hypothetical protein